MQVQKMLDAGSNCHYESKADSSWTISNSDFKWESQNLSKK